MNSVMLRGVVDDAEDTVEESWCASLWLVSRNSESETRDENRVEGGGCGANLLRSELSASDKENVARFRRGEAVLAMPPSPCTPRGL
jgi:hypothetical protein